MMLSGWGRYPRQECPLSHPRGADELSGMVAAGPLIARGNGRGYGDCALSLGTTVMMGNFNRLIAFDAQSGQLVAEAGVLLADVISVFLPRGWFPAVTPGTKFVTIGGMVAADVHGKNHHRDGSFGAFIDWLDLLDAHGQTRRCSRTENPDLFAWTIGGMGLTGVIMRVAFRLRRVESGWIRQTNLAARNLAEAMALFEDHEAATYSVAWIDCLARGEALGRSIVMLGEHAQRHTLPTAQRVAPFAPPLPRTRDVPVELPVSPLNRWTLKAFNTAYWQAGQVGQGVRLVNWDSYFYPLDAIHRWNRIYGRRGFIQFQCALPLAQAQTGLSALLAAIAQSGEGSFLAVLKRFGAPNTPGAFSFPLHGYTLALDFSICAKTLALMNTLDRIVLEYGGRFYLAKDARMTPDILRASDNRVADFIALRAGAPAAHFQSLQSQRLGL